MRKLSGWLLLLLVVVLPAGCAAYLLLPAADAAGRSMLVLNAGDRITRSFFAEHDGLTDVQLLLTNPDQMATGRVILTLEAETASGYQVFRKSIDVSELPDSPAEAVFTTIRFPTTVLARGTRIQVSVDWRGEGELRLAQRSANQLFAGQTLLNGSARDQDALIVPIYDRGSRLAGYRAFGGQALAQVGGMIWLLTIPGAAVLSWLWRGWGSQDRFAQFVLATAAGLAVYPILLVWANLIDGRFGSTLSWLVPVTALGLLAVRDRHDPQVTRRLIYTRSSSWVQMGFWVVVGLIAVSRLAVLYSLGTPMWGDSVHHTLITQLLLDHGGLFSDWQPFANLNSFTYHFGFHSFAAMLSWLNGSSADQSVLWAGQLLNVMAVLVLYPLGARVSGRQEGGMLAVLFAGLLIQMPAYYTNWGRYTQLAGHVMLVAFVVIAWELTHKRSTQRRTVLSAGIILAGLFLTHYRIFVFAALFVPSLIVMEVRSRGLRIQLFKWTWVVLLSAALVLPWGINLFGGKLIALIEAYSTTPAADQPAVLVTYNAIGDLNLYLPPWAWALFGLGALWALVRRRRDAAVLLIWWAVILLAANPDWFGLPGAGILTNFAVFLGAYIPASILAALIIVELLHPLSAYSQKLLRRRWRPWTTVILLELVILLALLGAQLRLADINSRRHAMVTPADRVAAAWIQNNLPESSRFLVNSVLAPGEGAIVGTDAGWWLPYLTGRGTNLPPITYTSESSDQADLIAWTNQVTLQVLGAGLTAPETLALLDERGLTHVFIGSQSGAVGNRKGSKLDPTELINSPNFELLFDQDGAYVFEVVSP
jgi:hypothetical protein